MIPTGGQVRLLLLLSAAREAGLTPLYVAAVHSLAFLANVLSPVWDIASMDGKVLKRRAGPFYPDLQHDLDRLVGLGLVEIFAVRYVKDGDRWRLDASFSLKEPQSTRALDAIRAYADEHAVDEFLGELCLALSGYPKPLLNLVALQDATYADQMVAPGSVLDFAEWQARNYSAQAARTFDRFAPASVRLTPAEEVHLYLRHLQSRLTS